MRHRKQQNDPDLIVYRGNGPWCYRTLCMIRGVDGKSHGTVCIWIHCQIALTRQEILDRVAQSWHDWISQRNRFTIPGHAAVTELAILWGPSLTSCPAKLERTAT